MLAIYWQVGGFGFVALDDHLYVYQNPWVTQGLSRNGIVFAFLSGYAANWHPLTWLSHMLDVSLFGVTPGWHHLVNVLLHLVNTLLVFALLRTSTGSTWRSAFVAALFAAHPQHVESVAWISERKDVLSTLFMLLALLAWVGYARGPSARRYLRVAGFFALALLAKPMAVTLPFLLLLLDVWPLGRLARTTADGLRAGRRMVHLAGEKVPLLLMSAASSAMMYAVQRGGGAMGAITAVAFRQRLGNALTSCGLYLFRTVWPVHLAAFYPWPAVIHRPTPVWPIAASAAAFAAISILAWRTRHQRPYLLWGWLWFLGTLVPVIGLVQVGEQARADRYTYLPLLGVFVALTWLLADVGGDTLRLARWRAGVAVSSVALLAILSARQASTWRDSATLYGHALEVTEDNYVAWAGIAAVRLGLGQLPGAIAASEAALRIMPHHPEAWNTRGAALGQLGDPEAAIPCFVEALDTRPSYPEAWKNLGTAYGTLHRYREAATAFARAVELRPEDTEALSSLGLADLLEGDREGASAVLERLRSMDPTRALALARRFAEVAP